MNPKHVIITAVWKTDRTRIPPHIREPMPLEEAKRHVAWLTRNGIRVVIRNADGDVLC